MAICFSIDNWAAWAPGLDNREAWLRWLAAPCALNDDGAPAVTELPAMLRRRMDRLGKIALQAAYWGIDCDCDNIVTVFASRYGDVARSLSLLDQLTADEPLSPTAFSMSVHNAIGAFFSIARQDTAAQSVVAAGAETAEAAFTEALALLADDTSRVLVVYYETSQPAVYGQYADYIDVPHAWACLVRRSESGGISLSTDACPAGPTAYDPAGLSPDLDVLRFLLSNERELVRPGEARQWRWQRHA